eukprot:Gb_28876 [translate_table: standard]
MGILSCLFLASSIMLETPLITHEVSGVLSPVYCQRCTGQIDPINSYETSISSFSSLSSERFGTMLLDCIPTFWHYFHHSHDGRFQLPSFSKFILLGVGGIITEALPLLIPLLRRIHCIASQFSSSVLWEDQKTIMILFGVSPCKLGNSIQSRQQKETVLIRYLGGPLIWTSLHMARDSKMGCSPIGCSGTDSGGDFLRNYPIKSTFAVTLNEKLTRSVRQFFPHLAAKMRPPVTPVIRGRPVRRKIHICGRPRWMFVLLFSSASALLWYVCCGILTVLWALLIGLLCTLLHASFRTPNLKARLNTFREEFRAVWRNYSDF